MCIVHIENYAFLSPATFAVQVLRLLLAITLAVIVGALYNRYIIHTDSYISLCAKLTRPTVPLLCLLVLRY